MTHNSVKALTKKDRSIIFRLYLAFIWRFLVWSLVLKVIAFLTIETILFVTLASVIVRQGAFLTGLMVVLPIFIHLVACYLTLESLMSNGYHSGRYKLQVQATSRKKQ